MNLFLKIKVLIKKIIFCLFKKFAKKHTLARDSIVINQTAWELFDKSQYDDSRFDFISVNSFSEIDKKSYGKIIAYIGGDIEKALLKELPNLKWLQLSSHGFNGFNKKELYPTDSIAVTNMHGIFSEPIATFCITAWYVFHCPAFHRRVSHNVIRYNDTTTGE